MIRCPKCDSENVRFSKKHSRYDCEDCRHEFVIEKPFAPLRIFLSYGHDNNEDLVRRIKADLEKRGHDVWFDKSEIKSGHDWRRAITEGIVDSQRVLSFLSKHSTRDPGVCLDEIAIAIGAKGGNIQTILVESEQEVKPPPSISHIQWLDMHDWKEKRSAGEAAWEQWYQGKLAEIVAVVESDESRRFAGEIKTLEEYLKPISSDSRIFQLLKKGMVGRAWLVDAIEQWRNADRASRLFWIMGAPGVGKSAFAAHLAHYGRDKVIAVQFCEYDKPDHRNPHRIVRTLAFQMATRLPDYRKLLLTLPELKGEELDRKNPAELFDYLLANPLKLAITGGRERYLIVIDALDEAGGSGRNELVEMLARNAARLPDWIGIVVTSRPESDVVAPLQGLNPFVLDTATESNRADIRDYLRRELASPFENRPDADRLVEQILEKSEGVFLYVERFCDDVQRGHLSLDRPEEFPQGLGGIFFQYFQRQFPDLERFRKEVRPALRAILAAREPLPVEILQRLFNWQDEELRDFTRILGSLFPVTEAGDHEVIKPYHKSLADWLADETKAGAYFVSVAEGHRMLADALLRQSRSSGKLSRYALFNMLAHMAKAKRFDGAANTLANPAFLRAFILEHGVGRLAFAVQELDVACGDALRRMFSWVCPLLDAISATASAAANRNAWLDSKSNEWATKEFVSQCFARLGDTDRAALGDLMVGLQTWLTGSWIRFARPTLARHFGERGFHSQAVADVAVASDGRTAASVSADGTCRLWDTLSGSQSLTFTCGHGKPTGVGLSTDGRLASIGYKDGRVEIWDTTTGRIVWNTIAEVGPVNDVLFLPSGKTLAIHAGEQILSRGKVWLLDSLTGRKIPVQAIAGDCLCGAFSSEGVDILAVKQGDSLILFDSEKDLIVNRHDGFKVEDIAVSGNGARAVFANWDDALVVIDVNSGRPIEIFGNYFARFRLVTADFNGRVAATISEEALEVSRAIRAWDLDTGHCLASFFFEHGVTVLAVAPDGRIVVVGDPAGRVHILHLDGDLSTR